MRRRTTRPSRSRPSASVRFQLLLGGLSLALTVTIVVLGSRWMAPGPVPGPPPSPLALAPPRRVDVWMTSGVSGRQILLKPTFDSKDRNAFHDRILSRRLGAPDRAYAFFVLVIANFDPDRPVRFEAGEPVVRAQDGAGVAIVSLDPGEVLARSAGDLPYGDRFVAEALGLRAGAPGVPPRGLRRFLVAFEGGTDPASWRSVEVSVGGPVPLAPATVSRRRLQGFLLRPDSPLVPLEPGDLASRPERVEGDPLREE